VRTTKATLISDPSKDSVLDRRLGDLFFNIGLFPCGILDKDLIFLLKEQNLLGEQHIHILSRFIEVVQPMSGLSYRVVMKQSNTLPQAMNLSDLFTSKGDVLSLKRLKISFWKSNYSS